jgi:hypothetical protein
MLVGGEDVGWEDRGDRSTRSLLQFGESLPLSTFVEPAKREKRVNRSGSARAFE